MTTKNKHTMTQILSQTNLAKQIIDMVCLETGQEIYNVKSKSRVRESTEARQLAMTIIKESTKMSLKSIGDMFSNRDHSTVIHAIQTISDLCETDKRIRQMYDKLKMDVAFMLPHLDIVKYSSSELSNAIVLMEETLIRMKQIKEGIDMRMEKEATNENL